jgi:ornithine carbamoyltransferase
MAKVNPQKHIQKRRTEQEMRNALSFFAGQRAERSTPSDIDDADIILTDCIEELLEARQQMEDVRAFVQSWQAKLSRK